MPGWSNKTISSYNPRNSRPTSVLSYVTLPAIVSIRIRSFDLIKPKYCPDCAVLILQRDIIFVLPLGLRNSLNIPAIISNLLRFLSETFLVLNVLCYLSRKSKPFPKQTVFAETYRHAFLTIDMSGMPYKHEGTKAVLPSSVPLLSHNSSLFPFSESGPCYYAKVYFKDNTTISLKGVIHAKQGRN